jgi:hypothetical protein
MRTVTTANSVYQINEADHLIRRVSGANDPTPRQGVDGEWQAYDSIQPHFGALLITWAVADCIARCTWTSNVVSDVAP